MMQKLRSKLPLPKITNVLAYLLPCIIESLMIIANYELKHNLVFNKTSEQNVIKGR